MQTDILGLINGVGVLLVKAWIRSPGILGKLPWILHYDTSTIPGAWWNKCCSFYGCFCTFRTKKKKKKKYFFHQKCPTVCELYLWIKVVFFFTSRHSVISATSETMYCVLIAFCFTKKCTIKHLLCIYLFINHYVTKCTAWYDNINCRTFSLYKSYINNESFSDISITKQAHICT